MFKGKPVNHIFFIFFNKASLNSEKLYEIEHPKHTKLFNEISAIDETEQGYWISKKWCKGMVFSCSAAILAANTQEDWKLVKPRMHVAFEDDPGPNSPEFYNHVYCEHGGLLPKIANRRKISRQVGSYSLL